MEDIVAIQVKVKKDKYLYFLTWGRIFDPGEEESLVRCLKNNLIKFGIKEFDDVTVCENLQLASKAKYFYECYFQMCQKKIPYGKNYQTWCKKIKKEISKGKEIYFLGK